MRRFLAIIIGLLFIVVLPGDGASKVLHALCPENEPPSSTEGSASFTVVKVGSLTSGSVVSTTATPGDDETVCCGLNDTVTVM